VALDEPKLVASDPVPLGVAVRCSDDAIELAGALELADLTETEQDSLGVLAVLSDRLDGPVSIQHPT
jgi:hypothetical protein